MEFYELLGFQSSSAFFLMISSLVSRTDWALQKWHLATVSAIASNIVMPYNWALCICYLDNSKCCLHSHLTRNSNMFTSHITQLKIMMTSWHGNAFPITSPLWGESKSHWWILLSEDLRINGSLSLSKRKNYNNLCCLRLEKWQKIKIQL